MLLTYRLWAAVAMLLSGALALAQNPTPGQNGTQTGASNSSGSTNSGSGSSTSPDPTRQTRAILRSQGDTLHSGQNDLVFGRVILGDGGDPGAGILVQRVCGPAVAIETHTDSRGRFVLARGANKQFDPDTSSQNAPGVWGCEIRASMAGYTTATMPVGAGRTDDGEVLLLLHREGGLHDMTVSAANLLAPKNAQKAYQKGLDAVRRHAPDQAQQSFLAAVGMYPRYSAAWLELGKVYEQRGHKAEAREAYSKAIAADGEYLFPYERLYLMDIRESRWQEAADTSIKLLRMDPYEFPTAFYFNAAANLQLNRLDDAERSAREVAKLEGAQAEPRGNYLLGLILWRKGDLDGAKEKLETFLAGSPGDPELNLARKALAGVEQGRARQKARQEAAARQAPSPVPATPVSSPEDVPGDR